MPQYKRQVQYNPTKYLLLVDLTIEMDVASSEWLEIRRKIEVLV